MSQPMRAPRTLSRVLVCCAIAAILVACDKLPASVDEADQIVLDAQGDADASADTLGLPDDTHDSTPDLAPDVSLTPQIRVRFAPDETDFYRVPWPSDARLTPAGTPDMSDFPHVREGLLVPFRAEIERDVFGFSTMPVVYIALEPIGLDGDLPDHVLPATLDTLDADAPIQLIDLSEEGCGGRVPLEVMLNRRQDRFLPANVLQIAPAIGAALAPATTYGVVLLRDFGAPAGLATQRPEPFTAALDGSSGDAFAASLAPLRACAVKAGLRLDDIAVATVFTTQDPLAQTRALHDFVMDPDSVPVRALLDWRESEAWTAVDRTRTFVGLAQFPIFQDGKLPYDTGGALVFDADGVPQIQRWDAVPIAVTIPYSASQSTEPLPVAVFLDGTGWDPWFHLYGSWMKAALAENFAVVSFMPQFHGGRAGFMGEPEIPTFNFLNPPSGRSNFRQQTAEAAYFVRVINDEIMAQPGLPPLDTSHIVYGGHSQGALIGAMLAAVDDQFEAFVLNGLSSYLSLTIVHRKDILDFEAVIKLLLDISREHLDRHYPILQIMQLGADVIDTYNYAPQWRGWPANPDGNHVFVINGFFDETTAQRGMDQLTLSADLPVIAPPGWNPDIVGIGGPASVTIPAQGNTTALSGRPLTIATWLQPDTGHFTVFEKAGPRELAVHFWTTALEGIPRLYHDTERICGDGHDNDEDQLIDCDDPDCSTTFPCMETVCDDGIDDDGNALTDCDDPACEGVPACTEVLCGDLSDDDGDGLTDCDDPDCVRQEPCAETLCGDGLDADADGLTDCDDPDCAGACVESCGNGIDDDLDGSIDCLDEDCLGHPRCPEDVCDDGIDNDNDGLTDCDDWACFDHAACPWTPEELCDDGVDNDNDGLIDCDEASCRLAATCPRTACSDADLGASVGVPLVVTTLDVDNVANQYPNRFKPGGCVAYGYGEFTPDVVFQWTAPADGRFTFTTFGSDFDTVLSLYPAGCVVAEELEIACDDDEWPNATSQLVRDMVAGESVVIVVSPYETPSIRRDASSPATTGRVVLSVF